MKKKGPIYYDCWFSHSRDYFKCLHGLQGAKVVTAKKDERGIIEVGNYLPFSRTKAMDKTTEEKLLELPHPFFVSKILVGKSKKVYQQPEVHYSNPLSTEKFVFPESEEVEQ